MIWALPTAFFLKKKNAIGRAVRSRFFVARPKRPATKRAPLPSLAQKQDKSKPATTSFYCFIKLNNF